MSDFIKNECFKFYNNCMTNGLSWQNIPKETVENFLKETGIEGQYFEMNMKNIEHMYKFPKKIETFGIYEGR